MKELILKDNSKLIIRAVEITDAANLIEYLKKIGTESDFLTFGENEINLSIEEEEAFIESGKKANNSLFIIAEIDGKILGSLTFRGGVRSRTEHFGELGVSVLKDYWSLSIGRLLLEYLLEWAKETNIIKKINLKVRTDNLRAISLYEKFGFRREGLITRYFCIDGIFYDVIEMGIEV